MTWMQTRRGRKWDLLDPKTEDVNFAEIGHALAHICRFTGHTSQFYSVAEHCCRVHDLMPNAPQYRLAGLLHDAHEAFIGDVSTPLSLALEVLSDGVSALSSLKARHDGAIFAAANLPHPLPSPVSAAVNAADATLMMTERRDLLGDAPEPWGDYEQYKPLPERIKPWSPDRARREFLYRLSLLGVGYKLVGDTGAVGMKARA